MILPSSPGVNRLSAERVVGACVALLLVVQADWILASRRVPEGPILIILSRNHGLTTADLCAIAMTLVALAVWFSVVFADAGDGPGTRPTSVPFRDPPRTLTG